MKHARPGKCVTDHLRSEIDAQGITGYRVAKETGISEPTCNRFIRGEVDGRGDSINAIASYLGLVMIHKDDLAELRKKAKGRS